MRLAVVSAVRNDSSKPLPMACALRSQAVVELLSDGLLDELASELWRGMEVRGEYERGEQERGEQENCALLSAWCQVLRRGMEVREGDYK